MTKICITRRYFSEKRKEFMLEEDRYTNWVLLAAQSGRFAFSMDEQEDPVFQEAGFGELVLCPPGVTLKRKVLEPLAFLFIEFTSEQECPQGKILVRDIQRLNSTFNYLRYMSVDPLDQHDEFANHFIQDLLYVIAMEKVSFLHYISKDKKDPIISRALAYIDNHAYGMELNMQQIAKELGMSASQLTRRFQQAYNQTPIAYVTSLRLTKARSLLIDTNETLDSIAEQCGYQNAFYFSRVFKSKLKINPSTYRSNYRF